MREKASKEGVTLSSHLSSKLQSASMPLYTPTKPFARGIANRHVLIGPPLNVHTHAVACAKFKTTKIYSQGILVNYTKICTNENSPLHSTQWQPSPMKSSPRPLKKNLIRWWLGTFCTKALLHKGSIGHPLKLKRNTFISTHCYMYNCMWHTVISQ